MNVKISFVIPTLNEEKSVETLYKEISKTMSAIDKPYEIIFVDDGSTDGTLTKILALRKRDKDVKVISHRGNWGKSVALMNGFAKASGEIIITMDADLQDDPKEIPNFLAKIREGYALVSGWKRNRHDPLTKTIPSKIGNLITRILTEVKIHDLNCGYKAYKREVVDNLNLYGELYKFIPVLVAKENFRIAEIPVMHKPRVYGKSKFGWERNVKGVLDLITIAFLAGYVRRPGHFFGGIGLVFATVGILIGLYITYLWITTGSIQFHHPLLFLGILLITIGVQLITTGLLAEMFLYSSKKFDYSSSIEKTYD